jgi:hypothetical protein
MKKKPTETTDQTTAATPKRHHTINTFSGRSS